MATNIDDPLDFEIDGLELFVEKFIKNDHSGVDFSEEQGCSTIKSPNDKLQRQQQGEEDEHDSSQKKVSYTSSEDDLTLDIPVLENDVIQQVFTNVTRGIPKSDLTSDETSYEYMLAILPSRFQYEVIAFATATTGATSEGSYFAQLKCNIHSKQDIIDFVRCYEQSTKQTLRISKTQGISNAEGQTTSNITMRYRCQHNTRSTSMWEPGRRIKNTKCPFYVTFKVKTDRTVGNINEKFCLIDLNHSHNHSITLLNALSFRDCSSESKEKMFKLFEKRYTPSLAYGQFKKELRESCSTDTEFELKFADRSVMPRLNDFKHYYKLFNNSLYGEKNGEKLMSQLHDKVEKYNEDFKDQDGKMEYTLTIDEVSKRAKLILVIVTPLMARVHKYLQHSSELVFSDSTSNLDDHNLRFLMLCTHSVAGGLPLATIVMSDETEETFKEAFKLLKKCLPPYSFYNRGETVGPKVFLTDNCNEERVALSASWPSATLLLCTFHVLQAIWRWLFDKKNKIEHEDRPIIMKLIKSVMHSLTDVSVQENLRLLLQSDTVKRSPSFKTYFHEHVQPNIAYWCLAYRKTLPIRGNNTQNYAESQFLVIKQEILQRVKAYNVIELVDMVISDLEQHYKDKLLKVANGSMDGTYSKRYTAAKQKQLDPENVTVIDHQLGLYRVLSASSSDVIYDIDIKSGFCSCPVGTDGSPCKHQFAVIKKFKVGSDNFLPVFNPEERRKYAQIAHREALPIEYYGEFAEICNSDGIESIEQPCIAVSEYETQSSRSPNNKDGIRPMQDIPSVDGAHRSFQHAIDAIKDAINTGDSNLLIGVTKFSRRVCKMSTGKLGSALHCFDNKSVGKKSAIESKFKVMGRAKKNFRRGAIGVLPDSVKRRKGQSKTRKALLKGSKQRDIPLLLTDNTRQSKKRAHCLATVLDQNVPVSKKAGRAMLSRSKPSYKKKQK